MKEEAGSEEEGEVQENKEEGGKVKYSDEKDTMKKSPDFAPLCDY